MMTVNDIEVFNDQMAYIAKSESIRFCINASYELGRWKDKTRKFAYYVLCM